MNAFFNESLPNDATINAMCSDEHVMNIKEALVRR